MFKENPELDSYKNYFRYGLKGRESIKQNVQAAQKELYPAYMLNPPSIN